MITNQSKLTQQLQKQAKTVQKTIVEEDKLEDIYQIITKIESKNLMLVELLSYLIEKGFVRNEHKLQYYMDLYDSIKGTASEEVVIGYMGKQDEEEKFTCKKFIRVFKQIAKKQYPSDPLGFENYVYKAMIATQHSEDIRLKLDDNVKKFLTRETINLLRNYERELQIIFEMYLP